MTVSNQQVRVSYLGDGTSKTFPVPFPFYLDTDITVLLGNLLQSSGYSITGGEDANGNPQTGNVIFAAAPATGVAVQFILDVPLTQLVQLVDGTGFPSSTLNQVNDRAVQALLRLADKMGRSIVAPDGDVSPQLTLPPASTRANTIAIFDSNGNFSTAQSLPPGTVITGNVVFNLVNTTVSSTPGVGNLGMGYLALANNGTQSPAGNNNTAFGYKALNGLTGGASNPTGSTAVGYIALQNSNGATNTAVGDNTMANDLTGSDNQAFGAQALFSETNSTGNNCFGFQCGYFITTGNANCLFGNYAGGGINGPTGVGITTGTGNCGFGGSTLANVTTAGSNSAFGTGALGNTTGGANVALGYFAGNHATSSGEFYLDNQDRGNNANEIANAPIYGNFGPAAVNNRLRFNAQLSASVGTLCSTNNAPTIASASVIAPTAAITFVSGTTAVTGITVPSWMNNGGRITLIPTGVFTWTTATNIALAGTAVVSKALDFIWDAGIGKWYPSYIS